MKVRLTCKEFVEFLRDYLAGELPRAQLERFNAHLAACPACVSYTRTYREAVRLGRMALRHSDGPVPGDVPEELVLAILAAQEGPA